MFTTKKIIFETTLGKEAEEYMKLPVPSKKIMPEWYKKIPNFIDKDFSQLTVKKCMPFLDALTMGYILTTGWEIIIMKKMRGKDQIIEISYPAQVRELLKEKYMGLEQHRYEQFSEDGYEYNDMKQVIKITAPWIIKTPPGYSCLFIPPLNRVNPYFRPVSGVVDTDQYPLPVSFPSIFKEFKEDTKIVPIGTPIVMVIPFKRESWKMEISHKPTGKDGYKKRGTEIGLFRKIYDNYKSFIWHKKDFS